MTLAQLQPPWGGIVAAAVTIVFFGGLGLLILKGLRWFTAGSLRAQARRFEGLTVAPAAAPGLVAVVFHTYSGLLVFVKQTEYRFWASPADARNALWRLHKYNLTRGFFAYGALVIPLLSIGNYVAQKRRITQQEAAMRSAGGPVAGAG